MAKTSRKTTKSKRANSDEYHRGYWDCMKEWMDAKWQWGVGYSPNPKIHKKLKELVQEAREEH